MAAYIQTNRKSYARLQRENERLTAWARKEERAKLKIGRAKVEVDNIFANLKLVIARVTGEPLHEVVTWPAARVVKEIERRLTAGEVGE